MRQSFFQPKTTSKPNGWKDPTHQSYPFFHYDELKCKCGCEDMLIDDVFMTNLVDLRAQSGFPFVISSGYRCPAYNAKVSGSGYDGPHTADAVDIAVSGKQAHWIVSNASKHGLTRIGVSQRGPIASRFVHLDGGLTAPHLNPWIWSY